jgi:hypothetical protein
MEDKGTSKPQKVLKSSTRADHLKFHVSISSSLGLFGPWLGLSPFGSTRHILPSDPRHLIKLGEWREPKEPERRELIVFLLDDEGELAVKESRG